jgi:hypothetical protein
MAELTASIVHEVNQPIAAVVANAEACLSWLARRERADSSSLLSVSTSSRRSRNRYVAELPISTKRAALLSGSSRTASARAK